jgi:hypothetical protein
MQSPQAASRASDRKLLGLLAAWQAIHEADRDDNPAIEPDPS